jgi:hypothetical protein
LNRIKNEVSLDEIEHMVRIVHFPTLLNAVVENVCVHKGNSQ